MNGPAAMLGPGPPDIGVKKPIKKSASTSVTVPRHSHSMRRRSAQAYSTEGQPGVVRKEGQTAHTPSHTQVQELRPAREQMRSMNCPAAIAGSKNKPPCT